MTRTVVASLALLVNATLLADEPGFLPPPPAPPAQIEENVHPAADIRVVQPQPARQTLTQVLEHRSAREVADSLDRALRRRHHVRPQVSGYVVDSPVVIVPDDAANALIITATRRRLSEIRSLVEQLDTPAAPAASTSYAIRLTGAENRDGVRQELAEYRVATQLRKPARIVIRQNDGATIEIELRTEEPTSHPRSRPATKRIISGPSNAGTVPSAVEENKPLPAPAVIKPWRTLPPLAVAPHLGPVPPLAIAAPAFIRPEPVIALAGATAPQPAEGGKRKPAPAKPSADPATPEVKLVRMVYPVLDLCRRSADGREAFRTDELVRFIRTAVAPESWVQAGGAGSIAPTPGGNALVVRQTKIVHERISELLETIRRLRTTSSAE